MAKYKPQYAKRSRKVLLPMVIYGLTLVMVASLSWGAVAKYTREQKNNDNLVKSMEFYFTSDYLTAEGAEYTLNPGTGDTVSVTFSLRNYEGLKVSELPISYTVEVTGEDGTEVEYGNHGMSLPNTNKTSHEVTVKGLKPGKTYVVTAEGYNQYKQTLKATYIVEEKQTGVYKNTKDAGEYVLLTVWTENCSGAVVLTAPAGLIPDSTDTELKAIENYNNGAYAAIDGQNVGNLSAYSSRVYRFFKAPEYSTQKTEISVTVGGVAAAETALE